MKIKYENVEHDETEECVPWKHVVAVASARDSLSRKMERAKRLLKRIQWSCLGACPECCADWHGGNGPHESYCELAALLAETA